MSKYLIDESPLIVLPSLAAKIGLNESIFVQQVHYFLMMKLNVEDGYYWTYNSRQDWLKQFPFWSDSTLKRTITSLEKKGIIISGNYNKMPMDKTKWYRIDYDKLNSLFEEEKAFDGRVQNDPTIGSKWTNEGVKMTQAIPYITTNTSTNINNKPIQNELPIQSKDKFLDKRQEIVDYVFQISGYKPRVNSKNTKNALEPLFKKGMETEYIKKILDFKMKEWSFLPKEKQLSNLDLYSIFKTNLDKNIDKYEKSLLINKNTKQNVIPIKQTVTKSINQYDLFNAGEE